MNIKKYKATITGTSKEVVGYIIETRMHLGNGSYSDNTQYLICVNEKSMPGGNYGTFKVDKESIVEFDAHVIKPLNQHQSQIRMF